MTHIAKTSRERFLQAVNDELDRFERREDEFRKKEREEQAKELRARGNLRASVFKPASPSDHAPLGGVWAPLLAG